MATKYETFKARVKLLPGQTIGFVKGRGYFAAGTPTGPKLAPLTKHEQIVQRACSQLGQTESPPNSNRSKFSIWFGLIGPWCAMFVSWCCQGLFQFHYSYVPTVLADARAGRYGLKVLTRPENGCFPCYDWPNTDGVPDHIGIYATEALLMRLAPVAFAAAKRQFGPLDPGQFWAVEGNTSVGSDSNGGMTMIRKRNLSNVEAFVLVS